MNRIAVTALLLGAGLSVTACGGAAAGGPARATASPSPSPRVRNGAAGELVKMTGQELVLNSAAGDVTVVYSDTTTFVRTSTGSLADVAVGKCIAITGQKDATGALVASGVQLSGKVNGTCAAQRPGGGPAGPPRADATAAPTPRFSPRPNNFSAVFGEVVAVSGTTIQVKDATGAVQTLTVPTTVAVRKSAAAAASDLALHQCITAQGPRDSSGKVVARSIAIVPAGPSGCSSGGGGGFGRFGGGGGRGGAGAPANGAGGPPGD